MLYYRPHRLASNKLIARDSGDTLCTLCDTTKLAEIIHEGSTMRVVRNRMPYDIFEDLRVNDHLMIVPKQHRTSFGEFTTDEKIEYIDLVAEYEGNFYNIYTRSRGTVTRSVTHLHTHLIQTKGQRLRAIVYINKPYLVLHGTRLKELVKLGKKQ